MFTTISSTSIRKVIILQRVSDALSVYRITLFRSVKIKNFTSFRDKFIYEKHNKSIHINLCTNRTSRSDLKKLHNKKISQ